MSKSWGGGGRGEREGADIFRLVDHGSHNILGAADALVESPAVKLLGLGCWRGGRGRASLNGPHGCWARARCCGRHGSDEINTQDPGFGCPPEMARKEDGGSHGGSATNNAGGLVGCVFNVSARIRGWAKKVDGLLGKAEQLFPQSQSTCHMIGCPLFPENPVCKVPPPHSLAQITSWLALCPLLHSDLHPVSLSAQTP